MIVMVTGGSSGIGHAIVRRLAAGGHHVFAASRNPERSPLPDGVVPVVLDVGSSPSVREAMGAVVSAAGGLDALVNNAGVSQVGPLEETDEEEAHHVFDVNFFGPLRLARWAVPHMRARGFGRIVNITSMNDALPAPFGGYYSASKAALASASFVMDAELASFGIRVTTVAPGFFRTEMAERMGQRPVDLDSAYRTALGALRSADQRRIESAGDPDQVAAAVEDCLSSADPPARIVVGDDAKGFEKLLEKATADDLGTMLRDFVSELNVTPFDS